MNIKVYKPLLFVLAAAVLAAALAGCGQSEPAATLPEPEYAGAITDTVLQGLSENDLEKYTRHGNAEFKAAVTPEVFETAVSQIGGKLGAYQSKAYLSTEETGGLIIVHYRAKYANTELGVRMVFDKDHLVAGQFFE